MPRIACKTLGCKVNQYDTEAMLELFEKAGYESVPFEQEADVYIVNTCTVTGTGDSKSLKLIRRLHREHPEAGIIAAGCLAQRKPKDVALDGVKLVIGVQRRSEVVELFEEALRLNTVIDATAPLKDASFENLSVSRHEGKTRATMKIQEGCNRYCSYCVIPYVRGPIRSMKLDDVRAEAERLGKAGYREIVVTGIHLASYGMDTGESLLEALRAVANAEGVERVRLGSLEPKGITKEFAEGLASIPGICPQFHLSLQSGSAAVLKRMNRRYSPEEYLEACANLRTAFDNPAITTDVIVGFPGETEEEYRESEEFVKTARLARLHVFPYSRRSGTVADRMLGQVDEQVKKERTERLISVGDKLESDYVASCAGKICEVLYETEVCPGVCEGYTKEYVRVRAHAEPGEIARTRITRTEGTLSFGEVIS